VQRLRALSVAIVLLLACSAWAGAPARAEDALPLALQGYDVVAYFADARARIGVPAHQRVWDERRYRFASAGHETAFARNPEHYLPQFAGFCATGISLGVQVVADPRLWKIVDGKLYVFASADARDMADKDPEILRRAAREWEARR